MMLNDKHGRLLWIPLLLAVAFLLAVGLIALASTTYWSEAGSYKDLIKQSCGIGIGVVIAWIFSRLPQGLFFFKRGLLLWFAYIGVVALLVWCFTFDPINGERRWVQIPGIGSFQPSEIAKSVLMLVLANYAFLYQDRLKEFKTGYIGTHIIMGIIVLLIFFETDMGTAMSLGIASLIMLNVAGVRLWHIMISVIFGVTGLAVGIRLDPGRFNRIMAFLDLEAHRQGSGYQQYKALEAFQSGRIFGTGLGQGTEKHQVPFAHTDFIYSAIAEEMGMVMSLSILLAYAVIAVVGIFIALGAKDIFNRSLAVGLTAVIVVPAFINIGVVTASLPNTGLPLPLISYGGTNLVLTLAAVGLLMNVFRHTSYFSRRSLRNK